MQKKVLGKNKTAWKKIAAVLLSLLMIFLLAACSNQSGSQEPDPPVVKDGSEDFSQQPSNNDGAESTPPSNIDDLESQDTEADVPSSSDEISANSNILVVYFSHTGENYSVGVIEKGNTHIIADMIAEETGADMFEIQPVDPYPDTYKECTGVAKQEQNDNARPEIVGSVENMEQYDTVFLGYPIWWGDLPMAVYTFLENYDFSGKTIIPFCTHEGSGLSGTARNIENACPGVTVLDGFAIRGSVAQNEQDKAKSDVVKWLDELDY